MNGITDKKTAKPYSDSERLKLYLAFMAAEKSNSIARDCIGTQVARLETKLGGAIYGDYRKSVTKYIKTLLR